MLDRIDTSGLQAAAPPLGLNLLFVKAENNAEIDEAFTTFSQNHVDGILIETATFFNRRMERLAALAARYALPAIFPFREYTAAGGLMSYGSSIGYANRQLGIYAGRILNGAKPADLPVEQATRIELTLNLKTAKALGIDIPTGLLVHADEVIE